MKLGPLKLGRHQHIQKTLKKMAVHRLPDGTVDSTPRILLVFPIFTHMYPRAFHLFAMALLHAGRFCPQYKFDVAVYERTLIHGAMNQAAEACIQNPFYKALIAFDDDCLMPMHVIARLVAHFEHGNPIVSAFGFMRSFPHTTTVGKALPDGMTLHHQGDPSRGVIRGFDWVDDLSTLRPDEHGLVDVDFCGMPAMLISREALLKINPPHFGTRDAGAESTHDVYFCNRAKDAGFPIRVDVTLECGHIGEAPIVTSQTRAWALRSAAAYEQELAEEAQRAQVG